MPSALTLEPPHRSHWPRATAALMSLQRPQVGPRATRVLSDTLTPITGDEPSALSLPVIAPGREFFSNADQQSGLESSVVRNIIRDPFTMWEAKIRGSSSAENCM